MAGSHWLTGLWRGREQLSQQLAEAEPGASPGMWADPDLMVTIFAEPGLALLCIIEREAKRTKTLRR